MKLRYSFPLHSLAAALLLACTGGWQLQAQNELFADPAVARGKGFEIKRSQVEDAYLKFKANLAANGQTLPESQRADIEQRIVERLVVVAVVSAKATPADKATAQAQADKFLGDTKTQAGSESSFRRQLLALGLTEEQFKADILERAVVEQVIERELKPKILITDAQVKKFYDENPARFEEPELVKMQHIHISTIDLATKREFPAAEKTKRRQLADQTLARIKGGEDFAKLVKEVSDDDRSKERNGEYAITRGTMEPAFAGIEAAAFSLRPGQVSDVLTSAFGFHIIKSLEKVPARQTPLADIAEKIRDGLRQQEVQKLLPGYLEETKKAANVEIIAQPKS